MRYTYEQWLIADRVNRDIITRDLFESICELENRIGRLEAQKNPLKRMSHSFEILEKIKKSQEKLV